MISKIKNIPKKLLIYTPNVIKINLIKEKIRKERIKFDKYFNISKKN